MPYFVSSIIAVTSAMIILFTRYEADDSAITSELERMKSMFVAVDGFVNTYIQSGGDLTKINFQKLSCDRILLGSIKDNYVAENCDDDSYNDDPDKDNPDDDVLGAGMNSTLKFPSSSVIWHLIPNQSNPSSYKLLVDMRANSTLMSKAIFSESFSSREFCEKILFGKKVLGGKPPYDSGTKDFGIGGTTSDGLFVCEVFK